MEHGHIKSCIELVRALQHSPSDVRTMNLGALLGKSSSKSESKYIEAILTATADVILKMVDDIAVGTLPLELGELSIHQSPLLISLKNC